MTLLKTESRYTPNVKTASASPYVAVVVEGPQGTGKSTLCGQLAEYVGPAKTLLIATLAKETESWKYKETKVPYVLIEDLGWAPALGKFDATGFDEFRRLVRWLREEDETYEAVILDSGTELGEMAWHAALAPHGVGSPAQMDGQSRWLPYETLNNNLDQGIKELLSLRETAKKPKHVMVTWHIQPPKEDSQQGGVTKVSSDHAAKGIEYEGNVLPDVRGKYRRKLGSQFPTVVYTDLQTKAQMGLSTSAKGYDVQYMLQVRPDNDRHTKLSGPLPEMQYIPNDFKELLKLIQATQSGKKYSPPPPKGVK
jgi:hypothetical protein